MNLQNAQNWPGGGERVNERSCDEQPCSETGFDLKVVAGMTRVITRIS